MTVEELKHILFNLETIKELNEQSKQVIYAIEYEMEGVKGISTTKEFSKISVDRGKRLIELMGKKDKVSIKQQYYQDMLQEVQNFINSLEGREKRVILDRFKARKAIYEIADANEMASKTVYNVIDHAIYKYCNEKEDEC